MISEITVVSIEKSLGEAILLTSTSSLIIAPVSFYIISTLSPIFKKCSVKVEKFTLVAGCC